MLMNIYKDWKAKLESAYSFILKYSKTTVCHVHFFMNVFEFWCQAHGPVTPKFQTMYQRTNMIIRKIKKGNNDFKKRITYIYSGQIKTLSQNIHLRIGKILSLHSFSFKRKYHFPGGHDQPKVRHFIGNKKLF